jgi:hypothetical protein
MKLPPGLLFPCPSQPYFTCMLSPRKWSVTRIHFKCEPLCSCHQWDGKHSRPVCLNIIVCWWHCQFYSLWSFYIIEPWLQVAINHVTLGCGEWIFLLCSQDTVCTLYRLAPQQAFVKHNNTTVCWPVGVCFHQLVQWLSIHFLQIIPHRLSWIPPWHIICPSCNLMDFLSAIQGL